LVIAVVVMWVERPKRRTAGIREISITEWRSPTDFLLRTPGEEILQVIPRIGEWPASSQTRGGRQKPPGIKKKSLTKPFLKENLS
jgi:hypothetical protein